LIRDDLRRHFFFALASTKDGDHERVREVYEQFNPNQLSELWVTTNHVVFESIRFARRSLHHRAAVEMGERLYDESLARIHWVSAEEEYEAVRISQKAPRQGLQPR